MIAIKNERQYNATRKQIGLLDRALGSLVNQPVMSDPDDALFRQIQENALRSQLADLRAEAKEYADLRAGQVVALEFDSIEGLPLALIAARISSGMTQRDLADRVGIKEQMIQRYEASDYASASFTRMREVASALGLGVREEVLLPAADVSISTMFRRLEGVGIDPNLVKTRILPLPIRAEIESPTEVGQGGEANLAMRAAAPIARVFGIEPPELFGQAPLALNSQAISAAQFKVTVSANRQRLGAYAVYAHYLARLLLKATPTIESRPVPVDAHACRRAVIESYGELSFGAVVRYVWDLGIPVLPLDDPGAFHGALWRIGGRNVVVLKQRTESASRWMIDLLHELRHAGQSPEESEFALIEEGETLRQRKDSPREQEAVQFAIDVALAERAEMLARSCAKESRGIAEKLKAVVPRVAREAGVDVSALADYMAYRLAFEDPPINWWGAATNLQPQGHSPWREARDVLIQRVDLGELSRFDQELLTRAVTEADGATPLDMNVQRVRDRLHDEG